MSEGTRRVFLTRSGIGVAAAGVAAITPAAALSAHASGESAAPAPDLSAVRGSLVAFVHDVRATEISLMLGEEEIVIQDSELVARLIAATAR